MPRLWWSASCPTAPSGFRTAPTGHRGADARALADAVVGLLADEDRRREIGLAARRLVETKADYRRCMDDMETIYSDYWRAAARRKDI